MPARDYKKTERKRTPARAKPQRRPWAWLACGVVLGAAATWAIIGRDDAARSLRAAVGSGVEAGVERVGGAPEPERAKPRFEFYTMLPEMEVAVPEEELASARASSAADAPATGDATASPTPAEPGTYLLQVGSFRKREEAESLKAKLAFMGLEASIQTVTIDDRDTWNRVRIGPYSDLGVLEEARARLREGGYESMVLKIRS